MRLDLPMIFLAAATICSAQTAPAENGWRKTGDAPPPTELASNVEKPDKKAFTVQPGTKVPLSMINSISTKHAAEGDRIYLETVFPVLVSGKVVIPPGSYVAGTVTEVKRAGRVKGKAELYIRFDSLTLPNGVTREFRSRIGSLDGRASEELDKSEGKIKGEGNKVGDAQTIGTAAGAGAGIGGLATRTGMGAGIGAGAGAAAALVGVLLTRGPDAVLAKGTTLEMVLDRPLVYEENEIDTNPMSRRAGSDGSGPMPSRRANSSRSPLGRPW